MCRLEPRPLASASAWLSFYETHWEQSLDALEDLLDQTSNSKEQDAHVHRCNPPRAIAPRPTLPCVPGVAGARSGAPLDGPGDLTATRVEIDERVGGRYRVWQSGADGAAGGFEAEVLAPERRSAGPCGDGAGGAALGRGVTAARACGV